MRKQIFTLGLIYSCLLSTHAQEIPKLVKNGNPFQLLVENKPFLILSGELGNSSASLNDHMRSIWPRLKQMNLNMVIAPVYWASI